MRSTAGVFVQSNKYLLLYKVMYSNLKSSFLDPVVARHNIVWLFGQMFHLFRKNVNIIEKKFNSIWHQVGWPVGRREHERRSSLKRKCKKKCSMWRFKLKYNYFLPELYLSSQLSLELYAANICHDILVTNQQRKWKNVWVETITVINMFNVAWETLKK